MLGASELSADATGDGILLTFSVLLLTTRGGFSSHFSWSHM